MASIHCGRISPALVWRAIPEAACGLQRQPARPRSMLREGDMAASLEDALKRLEGAIGQIEPAVSRRLEIERRRGDLETELQIMQDDRARLAVELDGATARLGQVEAASEDVGRRVERAIGAIRQVLEHAEPALGRE